VNNRKNKDILKTLVNLSSLPSFFFHFCPKTATAGKRKENIIKDRKIFKKILYTKIERELVSEGRIINLITPPLETELAVIAINNPISIFSLLLNLISPSVIDIYIN
jgi:hypothetical protein